MHKKLLSLIKRGLRLRKEERGTAQAEFSIALVAVVLFIFAANEICTMMYTYVVLADAANEGVRYAIVHSADSSFATDIQNTVTTYAANSLHNVSGMSVNVSCPDGLNGCPGSVPGRVEVRVTYPYAPYVKVLSSVPTMHAYAEARLVY